MKTYNPTNFFKHTFCQFKQDNSFEFPENTNYKSKSDSYYFYTKEGVYRKSNHWGRVANCRWKLIANKDYKNQQTVIGFAKWTDFYPINSTDKIFYIDVCFEEKMTQIKTKVEKSTMPLFTFNEAQKKNKQIINLFKDDKWAYYYNEDITVLRRKVISEFINSEKSLQQIKSELKKII